VHYRAGRFEEALDELEAARNYAWYGQTMASPLFARVAERYLRAEVLFELGRDEEAKRWFATLGEISPSDLPYRSVAQLRLSEIAEREGDMEAAADYRATFETLWSDADPEMLARVSE
jgi:tetratricopeptide (TPR) repeat protein